MLGFAKRSNEAFFNSMKGKSVFEYAHKLLGNNPVSDNSGLPKVRDARMGAYYSGTADLIKQPIFKSHTQESFADPATVPRSEPEGLLTRRRNWGYQPHRKTPWSDWVDYRAHQSHIMRKS